MPTKQQIDDFKKEMERSKKEYEEETDPEMKRRKKQRVDDQKEILEQVTGKKDHGWKLFW